MSEQRILVIGAGIGGLTTALALVRAGFAVTVFEQARALREVGAGITLSSSAMLCLEMLGLAEPVRAASDEAADSPYRHYRTGRVLRAGFGSAPRPAAARRARRMHRADLQSLLVRVLGELRPDFIRLGRRLTAVAEQGQRVAATFEDGQVEYGAALVACDGVRSVTREALMGPQTLSFTNQVAFRCLVPTDLVRDVLGDTAASVFIGPGALLNRYPVRHGTLMNCVGLTRSDAWRAEGWNAPATHAEFLAHYAGWHPEVTEVVARAPAASLIQWGLFTHPPLPRWSSGRMTLLGDAAHPMLPFLGLGAVMAIEDAVILARALAAHTDPERALARYEAVRRPRTTRIYEASILEASLTQSRDPDQYGEADSPAHDAALYDFDAAAVSV